MHAHERTHGFLGAVAVDPARPDSFLSDRWRRECRKMDFYRQLDWQSDGNELLNTMVLLEHHRGMHGEATRGTVKKYAITPQRELLFLVQPDGEREYVMMQHHEVYVFKYIRFIM